MPDRITLPISAPIIQGPRWDTHVCDRLYKKPVLCEHYIHHSFTSRLHQHVGIEYLFCKSGDGIINMNGRPVPYKAPILVRMECRVPHNVAVNGIYDRWNLCVEPNALGRLANNENALGAINGLYDAAEVYMVPVYQSMIDRLEHLFISIATELNERRTFFEKIAILQLQELSYLFERLAHDAGLANSKSGTQSVSTNLQQFLDIHSYIQANLDQDISARTIAESFHYSEKHIYRLIQQHTGCSLGAYLKRQRIQRAENLLLATNLPIAQIGAAVGIRHPVQFSRAFHEVNGLSPSNYRLLRQAVIQ